MKGTVYLIGAGPGDPGLLTLRGKEILEKADVVVYDRLVSPAILGMCNPKAKMVDVGKMPTHHKVKQSEINKLLVQFACEMPGATIARLKGGDPFVFGRGGEEALELVAGSGHNVCNLRACVRGHSREPPRDCDKFSHHHRA